MHYCLRVYAHNSYLTFFYTTYLHLPTPTPTYLPTPTSTYTYLHLHLPTPIPTPTPTYTYLHLPTPQGLLGLTSENSMRRLKATMTKGVPFAKAKYLKKRLLDLELKHSRPKNFKLFVRGRLSICILTSFQTVLMSCR